MFDLRAKMLTALGSITSTGYTITELDGKSTLAAIDNMEKLVFDDVGIIMGDWYEDRSRISPTRNRVDNRMELLVCSKGANAKLYRQLFITALSALLEGYRFPIGEEEIPTVEVITTRMESTEPEQKLPSEKGGARITYQIVTVRVIAYEII